MDIKTELSKLTLPRKTFMEILKVHNKEVPMANLLAYFFKPDESHGLGDLFIRSLLETKCFNLDNTDTAESILLIDNGYLDQKISKISHKDIFDIHVKTEEPTEGNKRIDILIEAKEFVICIEFKINHDLDNPLETYQNHFKKEEYKNKTHYFVVLTPYRKEPFDNIQKLIKRGENKFRQVIIRHFITNVKEQLPTDYFVKNMANVYSSYLLDFIQTINNRSVIYKIEKLIKESEYTIESLPFSEVPKEWSNKIVELKLKNFIKNNKAYVYHKNEKGGFIETKENELIKKIRRENHNWQIENWTKTNDNRFQKEGTEIFVGRDFPAFNK